MEMFVWKMSRLNNYEIMNSPRIPVASVTLTRELKQEEAATTVGTTATPAAVQLPLRPPVQQRQPQHRQKNKH